MTFFASGNKVQMKWIKTDKELMTFTETVKVAMNTAPSAAAPGTVDVSQLDVMEQLKKLGELRDAGYLTPGEFDTKKTELLARM